MKPIQLVAAAIIGLLVGAVLVILLRPASEPAPEPPRGSELIDGKYLLVEESGGHWIYEKAKDGWEVRVKQLSPEGLQAIWGLQGQFLPYAIDSGSGVLINVPATQYSTETGTFQVIHRFYRYQEDKLVEVNLEATQRPQ